MSAEPGPRALERARRVDLVTLAERFRGCLLGLAVGDGVGARFEGQSAESIRRRFPDPGALLALERLVYTDDTQMAIGVAEALVEADRPTLDDYARSYVRHYQPWRGYGRGARFVLERIADGVDPREAAGACFPGGSYGNGAAMRVAPVGLVFHGDPRALVEQARESALPTHSHPLGVEGAVLLARAVGLLVKAGRFERGAFFEELLQVAATPELRARLDLARSAGPGELAGLGNGIEALDSVPTALACFACWPGSLVDAVGNAVLLGGDTDTIAAMTGALSGASLGEAAIPPAWRDALEDEPGGEGRSHLRQLADRLAERTAAASDRA